MRRLNHRYSAYMYIGFVGREQAHWHKRISKSTLSQAQFHKSKRTTTSTLSQTHLYKRTSTRISRDIRTLALAQRRAGSAAHPSLMYWFYSETPAGNTAHHRSATSQAGSAAHLILRSNRQGAPHICHIVSGSTRVTGRDYHTQALCHKSGRERCTPDLSQ
jgi:hypothetical protein